MRIFIFAESQNRRRLPTVWEMNFQLVGNKPTIRKSAFTSSTTLMVTLCIIVFCIYCMHIIVLLIIIYVNCSAATTQLEDPRDQWRHMQESMLKEYLQTAREDLQAKKDIEDIKQQRLQV